MFRTPDELAGQVAVAVSNLRLNHRMIDRALKQTTVGATKDPFLRGEALLDTTVLGVTKMVEDAGDTHSLILNLGNGASWWSTRLYLLAVLLQALTPVRQLAFGNADGSFAGMASVTAVRQGLVEVFPQLADFEIHHAKGGTLDDRDAFALEVARQWVRAGIPRSPIR